MLVHPKQLEAFLRETGREFPYKEVFGTRKRLYASWILMRRKQQHTARTTYFQANPSSMFDADTLTHLIVSRQERWTPIDSLPSFFYEVFLCFRVALLGHCRGCFDSFISQSNGFVVAALVVSTVLLCGYNIIATRNTLNCELGRFIQACGHT